MDEELVRLLEQHHAEMLAEMRQLVRQSVDETRADLGTRIAHVGTDLGAQIQQVRVDFGAQVEQVCADLGAQVEQTRLDLGTLVEGLRDEVHTIAEGHVGLDRELQELRRENDAAHRRILATIRLSHRAVNRRVTRLERRRKRG